MQRSGKDHSILMVLPSGIYHYKFIVDGEWRYIPDLPFVADEMGCVCNLLDVNVSIYSPVLDSLTPALDFPFSFPFLFFFFSFVCVCVHALEFCLIGCAELAGTWEIVARGLGQL